MIDKRDVIRMKIPYPSISDKLAMSAHMYICKNANCPDYEFVKCQTLKPYMLYSDMFKHYYDENPDLSRNPFQRTTRIDCDKIFVTGSVDYGDGLKTTARPDVCHELFCAVMKELQEDGYDVIAIDEVGLVSLNSLIIDINGTVH